MTKIVFFGTPDYVIPVLAALHKKYAVMAVVTQPPKPVGRQKKLEYSAVDHWAYKHKVPVITDLTKIPEADLGVLAAYGKIIPKNTLNKFKRGILNIHPSLLPKFRGASPIQAAIAVGEQTTGVSVIKMDEELDHGPIVSSFKEKILENDTTESLQKRLFARSSEFLIGLIPNYLDKKINLKEQDHNKATYTKPLTKQNGFTDPQNLKATLEGKNDPALMNRFIRAMLPWPIAWTLLRLSSSEQATKRLKLINAHIEDKKLVLDKVQLEGKNPVSWEQFKQGYPTCSF